VTFCNKLIFYSEMLAPRPTRKLEDHPLSAVHDYLFNIFTVSSNRIMRLRHDMVRRDPPNTETLIDASKEVSLEVNTDQTIYLLPHHQNAGQNHCIKIGNRCFENVAQFRYLGTTITNQNLIQEEFKRRLNLDHSVQNLSFSHLLSKEYIKL
jgi:hypothetical protein